MIQSPVTSTCTVTVYLIPTSLNQAFTWTIYPVFIFSAFKPSLPCQSFPSSTHKDGVTSPIFENVLLDFHQHCCCTLPPVHGELQNAHCGPCLYSLMLNIWWTLRIFSYQTRFVKVTKDFYMPNAKTNPPIPSPLAENLKF